MVYFGNHSNKVFAFDTATGKNLWKYRERNFPYFSSPAIDADVVIIGGGDTGADCLGTSHRQHAASVHQFEIMPKPPAERAASTPWPMWPLMLRTESAHEEGGIREFAVNTVKFEGDAQGNVKELVTVEIKWEKNDKGQFVPQDIPGTSRPPGLGSQVWPEHALPACPCRQWSAPKIGDSLHCEIKVKYIVWFFCVSLLLLSAMFE